MADARVGFSRWRRSHSFESKARFPGIRLEQYMNTARVSLCLAIMLFVDPHESGSSRKPCPGPGPAGRCAAQQSSTLRSPQHPARVIETCGDGVGYSGVSDLRRLSATRLRARTSYHFPANPRGIVTYLGRFRRQRRGRPPLATTKTATGSWAGRSGTTTTTTDERKYDQLGYQPRMAGKYVRLPRQRVLSDQRRPRPSRAVPQRPRTVLPELHRHRAEHALQHAPQRGRFRSRRAAARDRRSGHPGLCRRLLLSGCRNTAARTASAGAWKP